MPAPSQTVLTNWDDRGGLALAWQEWVLLHQDDRGGMRGKDTSTSSVWLVGCGKKAIILGQRSSFSS